MCGLGASASVEAGQGTSFKDSGVHIVPYKRRSPDAWRMTEAVATAVTMNVMAAAIERGDSLAKPQLPWPLVQTEPNVVSIPASTPAMVVSGTEADMLKVLSSFTLPHSLSSPQRQANDEGRTPGHIDETASCQKVQCNDANPGGGPISNINRTAAQPMAMPPIGPELGQRQS